MTSSRSIEHLARRRRRCRRARTAGCAGDAREHQQVVDQRPASARPPRSCARGSLALARTGARPRSAAQLRRERLDLAQRLLQSWEAIEANCSSSALDRASSAECATALRVLQAGVAAASWLFAAVSAAALNDSRRNSTRMPIATMPRAAKITHGSDLLEPVTEENSEILAAVNTTRQELPGTATETKYSSVPTSRRAALNGLEQPRRRRRAYRPKSARRGSRRRCPRLSTT